MIATMYPNGLISKASLKLPFINAITDRVDPQEGQGISVICFIGQTPSDVF